MSLSHEQGVALIIFGVGYVALWAFWIVRALALHRRASQSKDVLTL